MKNNVYVGKTVTTLRSRVNGHRNKYHKLVKSKCPSAADVTDDNILGAHLFFHHGLREAGAFNRSYVSDVVHEGDPASLRKFEQNYIDSLGSLYPLGLNQIRSVAAGS